ncbi:MAG: GAF domain-containing protein [Anaerolineae bacterium]|nr:GAF domain-containing protein [Anaerolineae bacterium]
MSHSQNNARFALRARWERLPVRTKLLVPVIVALLMALVIVLARILPTINALIEDHARETFTQGLEAVNGRTVEFFTVAQRDMLALMTSPEVSAYLTTDPDPSSVANVNARTNLEWQMTRHLNATLPFVSWHYLAADGQRVVHAEQTNVNVDDPQVFWGKKLSLPDGRDYFNRILSLPAGQIFVLPATAYAYPNAPQPEPLIQIAVPVYQGEAAVGVLVGAIRAQTALTEVMNLNKFAGFVTLLVDQTGHVVAMVNPSASLAVAIMGDPRADRMAGVLPQSLRDSVNQKFIVTNGQVYSTLRLKMPGGFAPTDWLVVANESESSLFSGARNLVLGNMLTLVMVFVIVISGVALIGRSVTRPLSQVSQVAARVAAGDFSARVPITGSDEVGQVAQALNTMSSRVSELVGGLESRVADRTRNLEIASEISRDAAQMRNIDELLQRSVNAIRDRFNFYHAQIFFIDDVGEYAVLVTSTGEAGRQLLERKHKLAVGSDSIVGQVTAKGRTFITLDTEHSEVPHRFNPLLPKTRSEMALPLRIGGKVIGALDVQSVEPNAFKESDVQIFQVLADQLAIAIDNARLLHLSDSQLKQVADLNRQLTSSAWNQFLEEAKPENLAFKYDLMDVTAAAETSHDGSVSAEIKVRGETIGQLSVQQGQDALLSEDDRAVLQAVADRVALAIENARLIEQSQVAASKIQRLYEASRTLGTAINLEDVYKIAVDYLSAYDAIDRLIILRAMPDPVYKPAHLDHSAIWERRPQPNSALRTGLRVPVDTFELDTLLPDPRAPRVIDLTGSLTEPDTHYGAALKASQQMGAKSMVIVPLAAANQWFGILLCQSERARAFNESFVQFVSAIADQIAIAIDNRRLFENVQAEARRNRALAEAAQISGQVGIDFAARMDNLFRVVAGPADFDRWWFGQLGSDWGLYRVTAQFANGSPLNQMGRIDLKVDQNALVEVIRIGELVVVNDPTDHFAVRGISQEKAEAFGKHIAVPLRVGKSLVGVLMMGRDLSQPDIDERDVQLAVTLATQIAIVMENQRLFASAETGRQTLETVLDSLPTGVLVIDAQTGATTLTNGLARELLGLDQPQPYARVHTDTDEPFTDDEFPTNQVLATRQAMLAEDITIVRPSGERIDLIANAAPILDAEGNLISSVAVFQDVTELRELQNVLQNSLRETTSLYEISRAIATENELSGIIGVVANQVLGLLMPDRLFAIFRNEKGELSQFFSVDMKGTGEVTTIEGRCPVPVSILRPDEVYTESNIAANPVLADDPQLAEYGVQSLGAFPFTARGRTVGWLVVAFETARGLIPDERRFLATLADQAAIAAENARLTQATIQALSETTLLYEASYAINRAVTIENALEIVRDQIKYFAPTCIDVVLTVTRHEVATLDWVVHWDAADPLAPNSVRLEGAPILEDNAILEGAPYFIDDMAAAQPEQVAQMNHQPGTRDYMAQASIPLAVGGSPTGRLIVSFNRPYRFGRLEQQFLSTVADQAAIVINNVMLVQQTQDSLEEIGTLYQSSRAITDASDLPTVLQSVIDHAAPPTVSWAMLIRLLTPAWDSPDATIEIAASWSRQSDFSFTGMRFTPDDLAIWSQLASLDVVWLDNISRDKTLQEDSRTFFQSLGLASVIIAPMAVGDKPIGALLLGSPEPWARTEREARIYSSLADQAAITIENRDLLNQAERRARQLQTSAEVSQAASSILKLDELLNRTVNLIRDSFHYDHVQIFLINPEGTDAQLVASTGEAGKQLLGIKHHLAVGSKSVIGQVTANRQPYLVADTADPRANHRPNPYLPHTRSEMALPLVAKNRIVGALDVQSNRPGTFTKEDESVLSNLADQIAIAIDNARLFELSGRRAEEMQFLFNTTRTATSIIGAEELSAAMIKVSQLVLDNLHADSVSVLLLDETGTRLIPHSVFRSGYETEEPEAFPVDYPLFKLVIENKQPLVLNDLLSTIQDTGTRVTQSITVLSGVAVPLLSGDNFVGILTAGKGERNGFNDDSVRLLQALSSTLSAIIQNARLLQEVQAANARLREVDKLKSQFLANMSHELRTPLNSIIGFSRVILKGIDGPLTELQEQDLATIHESGKHLLNLVNDILDQAKIEAGKMELSYGFFSMADLVKSVMSTAVGLVKDKPVRLHQEIEQELPQVWGDEFRSRQVLLNLISNAAKFTAQGSITVSAFRVEEEGRALVQVSVTDTGIGIPADKLESVFEAFQQVENSTARQYEGTGLGLPIARSLITMQGGRIWVTSEPNIGSTFSFTVPISQPEPQEQEPDDTMVAPEIANQVAEAIQQADAPQAAPRIVLAIDDELSVVNLYRRYLAKPGYEVIGGGANEAEELAITYQPCVILLDVNMPARSGWDVLAHLKDRDETFEIPVIVCTVDTDREQAFRLGAADYLMKPIDEQMLVDTVKRVELERDRRKILIIDDQPDSMRLIRDAIVADERFIVIEAPNGAQGVAMVNSHWPDLVILDLRMPEMDGFAVLDQLRADPETAAIPVLVVTADDLTDEERQRLGHVCIYQKQTVEPDNLLNSVVSQLVW